MPLLGSVFFMFCIFQVYVAQAHEGHTHGAAPANSSVFKFAETDSDSPMALNFKLRSGQEFGQYVGALPSINSFFGNEEISLNLNYEFQVRQFSSEQPSEFEDRDFRNHFAARAKKSISEGFEIAFTGGYETNQASRLARMINDYNSTTITTNLSYKFADEWSFGASYLYGIREFPNGTYTIPSASFSGGGEPIVPGEQITANESVTIQGTTDNLNEIVFSINGGVGSQSINFETKYSVNDSDLATRKFSGQALKVGIEKMLWSRIFAQASYALENREFFQRSDRIDTAELGLQKELSARMAISGVARNNQVESIENSSYWEGYAQLQYAF